VILGCASGELTVAAQRIPALVRAACARIRTGTGQCGKGTVASGPPDWLEESENDRTVAADCADLSA